ncbi:MAG TPA: hypothetical protein VFQ51_03210 [Vicinamibacteria bacterium]|nr:hypothetical protein [Vicinamibacteria bacterium]
MDHLRPRIRRWTIFLIAGLVLSGATAIPISTQLEVGIGVLGEGLDAAGRLPAFASTWLRTLRDGIRETSQRAPFMFYGTDWLAFGHFMIALAFVGALRDPVRNRWLYQFGMIACALVPLWALVFGQVRGIPLWWRAIDAAFGIVGFVPAWLCHRWTGMLEENLK